MTSDEASPPAKVAIIGGGCAAITAAFELSRPELAGRYDITIYQMGWRLGGKGASGRGPSGRIEEHGLHVWLGFYENAFKLLRECYAELATDPGAFDVADWRKAFITEDTIGISVPSSAEAWHNWSACFPPREGLPGDPGTAAELLSIQRYISSALSMLVTLIESTDSRRADLRKDEAAADWDAALLNASSLRGDPQRVLAAIGELIGGAVSASAAVIVEALAVLQAGIETLPSPLANPLTDLAGWIARSLRNWLEASLVREPYFQHLWEVMDLVVASVTGILRFGLLTDPRGFDAIDDYDWREWLRLSGASERALQSAFIRGLYDLPMAYEDGDPQRPSLSAAVSLRATLRMFFTYRGALYWRLRAGMGDVVFAPFYEVLRRRGVKFRFFHRLTNVHLAPETGPAAGEAPHVAALEFDVQARIKPGAEYSPLISVADRPCWPSAPDFGQLQDGERLADEGRDFESHWETRRVAARTLKVGKDFDFVVLGVSLGAVPHVCGEILARDARWRSMVENVKTIESQAFQVWLDQDLEALAWKGPNYIGSAFAKPFDTWCDMAHTIPEEGWADPPRTVLYFCGGLAQLPAEPGEVGDPGYPARRREVVRQNALIYLRQTARHLWPGAYDAAGEFRWDMLRDASGDGGAIGAARFETQYWRANVNPSDRYVLSVPGSARHRISPLDMTYDNMTIAGDWTACGLNQGCVEGAVISGRLAAAALAGTPRLEDIVGYDHP
ncbi:MAG TPA: FAD-dependent oxidoreductase [Phenylobacterium sp.]|nr:FAD-dependent oxidoreductase [Phenylobacterium sp.]